MKRCACIMKIKRFAYSEEMRRMLGIYLSGTGSEPRRHVIAFDIYGGGVDGTQWCTTVTKELVINGDMYEDAGTTSTY